MNLIIDVGNTYVKLAVFKADRLKKKDVIKLENLIVYIDSLKKEYKSITKVIIASVGKLKNKDISYIAKHYKSLILLNSDTKLPFKNLYSTPKTLGIDRIALVSASVNQFPKKNVLIIDAGTCITYDFITDSNDYLGGAISPGIRMRYKSLSNLTANLPLLETEIPNSIIGNSTNDSIHSGVVNGILKEIDGVIKEYEEKYSDLTVILTGGDANFLSKQLKSSIFANSNFLLEGLNYILQFNSN
ncbi:type III pantothenate kinase [Jejuia spongiicola]|uniref:Type III pantothenate kinase n=1 Tax=Jejuia spongiicola TaxID=2942207 RepID=A0ABT0QAW1_9FLAO|nr:type III pantothenate kinase [Jejuia spongiicola]MCL6294121.1 type III pantothenate kinase [Jejuia spongiicola]